MGATTARRPKVALPAPEATTIELVGLAEEPVVGTGTPELAAEGRTTVPFWEETVDQPLGAAAPAGQVAAAAVVYTPAVVAPLAPVAAAVAAVSTGTTGAVDEPVMTTVGAGVVTVVGITTVEVEGVAQGVRVTVLLMTGMETLAVEDETAGEEVVATAPAVTLVELEPWFSVAVTGQIVV